jgi:LysR family transcriptional regulator, hydrogen peroxide-inducible genes activator
MNFNAHDFSLRQLQYALAVLDTGGFRKAAVACHVSQPALSAQLAALERVLGTALFERSASGVLPTAAGLQVLAQARTVLGQAEELVQLTRRLGDPLASTLRLGVIPTLAPYVVPALLTPLHKEFPQLKLQWLEERTSRLKEELIRNGIDAGRWGKIPSSSPSPRRTRWRGTRGR